LELFVWICRSCLGLSGSLLTVVDLRTVIYIYRIKFQLAVVESGLR